MTDVGERFAEGLRVAGPATSDDVSITFDGQRLDSKEAVLGWWAKVATLIDADRAARTLPDPDELRRR